VPVMVAAPVPRHPVGEGSVRRLSTVPTYDRYLR
jgi:hypothetical protein